MKRTNFILNGFLALAIVLVFAQCSDNNNAATSSTAPRRINFLNTSDRLLLLSFSSFSIFSMSSFRFFTSPLLFHFTFDTCCVSSSTCAISFKIKPLHFSFDTVKACCNKASRACAVSSCTCSHNSCAGRLSSIVTVSSAMGCGLLPVSLFSKFSQYLLFCVVCSELFPSDRFLLVRMQIGIILSVPCNFYAVTLIQIFFKLFRLSSWA